MSAGEGRLADRWMTSLLLLAAVRCEFDFDLLPWLRWRIIPRRCRSCTRGLSWDPVEDHETHRIRHFVIITDITISIFLWGASAARHSLSFFLWGAPAARHFLSFFLLGAPAAHPKQCALNFQFGSARLILRVLFPWIFAEFFFRSIGKKTFHMWLENVGKTQFLLCV